MNVITKSATSISGIDSMSMEPGTSNKCHGGTNMGPNKESLGLNMGPGIGINDPSGSNSPMVLFPVGPMGQGCSMGPGGSMSQMGPNMGSGSPGMPRMSMTSSKPRIVHMGSSSQPNMGSSVVPSPNSMPNEKVYPLGQPKVLNPQNPNATPIYPCGICHKEVHQNEQAIRCESGCNFWFHRVCTGLEQAAFDFLDQEMYAEWVCDNCFKGKMRHM